MYVNNEIIQIDKQIRRRRDVVQHSFIITVKSSRLYDERKHETKSFIGNNIVYSNPKLVI